MTRHSHRVMNKPWGCTIILEAQHAAGSVMLASTTPDRVQRRPGIRCQCQNSLAIAASLRDVAGLAPLVGWEPGVSGALPCRDAGFARKRARSLVRGGLVGF